MPEVVTIRTEFGVERGEGCSCRSCRQNCMYIPGFLIPSDLGRMIPPDADPLVWAETNLLASPGAKVSQNGHIFRVPTLVMASKPDGSCIHYKQRKCGIWENSPFGCAFFTSCGPQEEQLKMSHHGLMAVLENTRSSVSLYRRIWEHLWGTGRRSDSPEEKRKRMLAR